MKKFLVTILCIVMVLSTMSISAFAEIPTDPNRSIDLVIDDSEKVLYAGDEITLDVVINGKGLADALWIITYNEAHFKLLSYEDHYDNEDTKEPMTAEGTIEGHHYLMDNSTYDDGSKLVTYTFETLALDTDDLETPSAFLISDTYAYT